VPTPPDDTGDTEDTGTIEATTPEPLPLPDEVVLGPSDAASGFGYAVGTVDVNGDGYVDTIVGAGHAHADQGAVYVYLGVDGGIDARSEQIIVPSDASPSMAFGLAMAGVGDVDGDGYEDILVGADGDSTWAGAAYLYYGSATGVETGSEVKFTAPVRRSYAHFGDSMSGVDDVNGDGHDDLVIGASHANSSLGTAYIYYGSASGVDPDAAVEITRSEMLSFNRYGNSVTGAGDVNGDGFADVLITSHGRDGYTGAAWVFVGSSTGLDLGSEQKITASDAAVADYFGRSSSGAGDVDGDGFDDIVIGGLFSRGSSEPGSAYVYRGSASGIDLSTELKISGSNTSAEGYFGMSVGGAMDMNGDGYDDIIVGAQGEDADLGAAYVYYGSNLGIDPATEFKITASDGVAGDHFGWSVAGARDGGGHGADQVLIGAHAAGPGAAYVYYGDTGSP